MIFEKLHRAINNFNKAFNWRRFRRDALHLGESLLVFGILYGIAEWCCTAASSFPLKPGAKPGCHFRKSRTRMESTGTGAPQHERRNALFNPSRNKSGRPLPRPPRPVLSCRAGLICGRIEDVLASDYPP